MRPYEVMVVFDAEFADDGVQTTIDQAAEIVRSDKAEFSEPERWGRRRLAYELDHKWQGNYVLFKISAEPSTVTKLDRALTLADGVIRHKVIHLPPKVAKSAQSSAPKRESVGTNK